MSPVLRKKLMGCGDNQEVFQTRHLTEHWSKHFLSYMNIWSMRDKFPTLIEQYPTSPACKRGKNPHENETTRNRLAWKWGTNTNSSWHCLISEYRIGSPLCHWFLACIRTMTGSVTADERRYGWRHYVGGQTCFLLIYNLKCWPKCLCTSLCAWVQCSTGKYPFEGVHGHHLKAC
jgi:hypothetical protein